MLLVEQTSQKAYFGKTGLKATSLTLQARRIGVVHVDGGTAAEHHLVHLLLLAIGRQDDDVVGLHGALLHYALLPHHWASLSRTNYDWNWNSSMKGEPVPGRLSAQTPRLPALPPFGTALERAERRK